MANVLTQNLSEPLDGTKTARVDISTDIGNLTIDRLTSGEPLLASGTLQYVEGQVREPLEGLPEDNLVDRGVERVPGAPHPRRRAGDGRPRATRVHTAVEVDESPRPRVDHNPTALRVLCDYK